MLQNIRKQIQGTTAKIVVGLIVISFAFFGIESILLGGGSSEIAKVNGEDISQLELQQAVDTQKRRLIAMMGDNFDPAILDDEQLGPQALEALINRKLLMQSAQNMKLAISEREIATVVRSMEQFQVDGAFSPEVYKSVLSSAGYTPSYFKTSLRDDMLVNQLRSGLAGSEFVTSSELAMNSLVISEQRDLHYFLIPAEKFRTELPVSDAEIDAYYTAHKDDYVSPESVDIEYIELELEDFRQTVQDSAIQEAFELAKQQFQYQTQNRVSHIFFESKSDDDIEERLVKAQDQLSAGVAFAEVAKEFSEDVGSAANGGDLGYSTGEAFPKAMEDAIAKLEPGTVSGPVETESGTHLILVTERSEGKEPTLESMRAQLEETIQVDEARVALLRTVESLKDLSFNAEDLGLPAKELGVTIKSADTVSRSQKEGLFSNPLLIEAAFSEEVLMSGHNSEVLELAGDHFVVLRVKQHHPSEAQPLESVRDEVIAAVAEEATRAAVSTEAQSAVAKLRAGVSVEEIADSQGYDLKVELGVDRRNTTVPAEVSGRVFELPAPSAETIVADYITTPAGDAFVVELLRVTPGNYESLTEPEQQQLERSVNSEFGNLINNEFQHALRERADITVL